MTHIGFCGLGIMGSGMAKRLLRAGFEITVYNRGAARAEELRQAGASVAAAPSEAAANADFVIAMVADDRASRAVWSDALKTVRPGSILIDSSTITPARCASSPAAVRRRTTENCCFWWAAARRRSKRRGPFWSRCRGGLFIWAATARAQR